MKRDLLAKSLEQMGKKASEPAATTGDAAPRSLRSMLSVAPVVMPRLAMTGRPKATCASMAMGRAAERVSAVAG